MNKMMKIIEDKSQWTITTMQDLMLMYNDKGILIRKEKANEKEGEYK